MDIDKSWMSIRNQLSAQFRSGAKAFAERSKTFINSQITAESEDEGDEMHDLMADITGKWKIFDFIGKMSNQMKMSRHGSAPLVTSATSGSSFGDHRHDPKGKRVREETRGKPILDHNKMFLNILAKTVRDNIPASTPIWKDVKKEDIELILNWMEVKFDYPRSDALFMDSIEQSMMAYLRDWCNMMRNHFTKMGGKRDIAFIKANPYKTFPSISGIFCAIISKVSTQNSENRFKQLYLPAQGSSSMISQMKAKAEMVTSRAEALTQTQSCAQSELGDGASSAEFVVGPEQVDEFQIVSKALGTRSRWQKGLEALPRLKSIKGQRAASTRQVAETIAILKQQLAEKDTEHARRIDETQRQMAENEAANQCRLEETQ
ncbi:hypothetical protein PanWU01x14_068530 [Parasponia andersonii]|uniref:Uncharacterized protein n=1 Tax=Parasponia andersonii TaxID=3476 RepID=A0A2P5DFG0_PARAD|nr:hypothetical protein PanWU01x14_068530 [Parasponia andersonii]